MTDAERITNLENENKLLREACETWQAACIKEITYNGIIQNSGTSSESLFGAYRKKFAAHAEMLRRVLAQNRELKAALKCKPAKGDAE